MRCLFSGLILAAATVSPVAAMPVTSHLHVCSGYSCTYKTRLAVTNEMRRRLATIMRQGRRSAAAERAAIASAVQYFERQATKAIGVADVPKGAVSGGGILGQMDCIDEATNTRALLMLLGTLDLLRHHRVEDNASRGFFIDGRYPHFTAVVSESGGKRWAIDSWYEPAGGPPDIMPLEEWRKRGVRGER